jgi:hypothetical protein
MEFGNSKIEKFKANRMEFGFRADFVGSANMDSDDGFRPSEFLLLFIVVLLPLFGESEGIEGKLSIVPDSRIVVKLLNLYFPTRNSIN